MLYPLNLGIFPAACLRDQSASLYSFLHLESRRFTVIQGVSIVTISKAMTCMCPVAELFCASEGRRPPTLSSIQFIVSGTEFPSALNLKLGLTILAGKFQVTFPGQNDPSEDFRALFEASVGQLQVNQRSLEAFPMGNCRRDLRGPALYTQHLIGNAESSWQYYIQCH